MIEQARRQLEDLVSFGGFIGELGPGAGHCGRLWGVVGVMEEGGGAGKLRLRRIRLRYRAGRGQPTSRKRYHDVWRFWTVSIVNSGEEGLPGKL